MKYMFGRFGNLGVFQFSIFSFFSICHFKGIVPIHGSLQGIEPLHRAKSLSMAQISLPAIEEGQEGSKRQR